MDEQQKGLQLGYAVDSLAACTSDGNRDVLLVSLSNFWGTQWDGTLALLSSEAGSITLLATAPTLPFGVPSATALSERDAYTGRVVLASGGDDGSISLWEASTAADSAKLEQTQAKVSHDDIVSGVAAGASNSQLASCSWDGTLRLWDCTQLLTSVGQLVGHSGAVHAVAWEPSGGSLLVSAGQDGTIKCWDPRRPSFIPTTTFAVGAPAFSLALPPRQPHLVLTGDQLGRLSAFDARMAAKEASADGGYGLGAPGWPLFRSRLFDDAVRSLACRGQGAAAGQLDVAAAGDDGAVLLVSSEEAAGGALATVKVACKAQGPPPSYIRALAWGAHGLYRGGWDTVVAPVPL